MSAARHPFGDWRSIAEIADQFEKKYVNYVRCYVCGTPHGDIAMNMDGTVAVCWHCRRKLLKPDEDK